jgi:hypothetical protein
MPTIHSAESRSRKLFDLIDISAQVSGGWTRVARLDFGCNYCNGPGTSQDLIANPALTCGKVADSRVLNILSGGCLHLFGVALAALFIDNSKLHLFVIL